MAGSGTALSGYSNAVWAGGANKRGISYISKGATNFKPGWIVNKVRDTTLDVEAATSHATTPATADKPLGVAFEDGAYDLDTAFADNSAVLIAHLKSMQDVYVPLETSSGTVYEGDDIYLSDGVAGHAQLLKYTTATTPTSAETKLAIDELAIAEKVRLGTAREYSADVAAVRWLKITLD